MIMALSLPKIKNYKVIPWGEINPPKSKAARLEVIALAAGTLVALTPDIAQAATKDIMIRAFWPIIDLVQGISYPLCFLMISGGIILIILGNRSKGIDMMKWAAVGYILIQFVPSIMGILADVGASMQTN